MEFLMTYGWAILVVLVAIGALAYFGVLNPSRFLPSSCTLAPGIGCDDFKVSDGTLPGGVDGTVRLVLRNGLGSDLNTVNVRITDTLGVWQCTGLDGAADGAPALGDTWIDGNVLQGASPPGILLTGCTTLAAGGRFKQTIALSYATSSGLTRNVSGSITSRVE